MHQNDKSDISPWSLGECSTSLQDRRQDTTKEDHLDASSITRPQGWLNFGLEVRNRVLKKVSFEPCGISLSDWAFVVLCYDSGPWRTKEAAPVRMLAVRCGLECGLCALP